MAALGPAGNPMGATPVQIQFEFDKTLQRVLQPLLDEVNQLRGRVEDLEEARDNAVEDLEAAMDNAVEALEAAVAWVDSHMKLHAATSNPNQLYGKSPDA